MPENNEGFVSRWSRRKQQVAKEEESSNKIANVAEQDITEGNVGNAPENVEVIIDPEVVKEEKLVALNKLTDEDMPDIETLHEGSDFSSFMSTGVSESLRRMALKRLFMGKSFNIRDGLDEYDDDYTVFEKMPSSMITSDMKHMVEVEAKRKLAKEQEEERQRMIASGELDESFDEADEFDEFADEDEDAVVEVEEYVDEYINVEGFDTTGDEIAQTGNGVGNIQLSDSSNGSIESSDKNEVKSISDDILNENTDDNSKDDGEVA